MHLKSDLTYKHKIWLQDNRVNLEGLLHYYEHTATDFVPTHELLISEGIVYPRSPMVPRM